MKTSELQQAKVTLKQAKLTQDLVNVVIDLQERGD
jgi:hypothetical protein